MQNCEAHTKKIRKIEYPKIKVNQIKSFEEFYLPNLTIPAGPFERHMSRNFSIGLKILPLVNSLLAELISSASSEYISWFVIVAIQNFPLIS